jgi:hypothetical protein
LRLGISRFDQVLPGDEFLQLSEAKSIQEFHFSASNDAWLYLFYLKSPICEHLLHGTEREEPQMGSIKQSPVIVLPATSQESEYSRVVSHVRDAANDAAVSLEVRFEFVKSSIRIHEVFQDVSEDDTIKHLNIEGYVHRLQIANQHFIQHLLGFSSDPVIMFNSEDFSTGHSLLEICT